MQPLLIEPIIPYVCPVCTKPLVSKLSGRTYSCVNLHSFDRAKEGYLNLLPVQFKHSKEPGDNKQMMIARRLFLEHGFYEPMAQALAMMIDINHSPDKNIQFWIWVVVKVITVEKLPTFVSTVNTSTYMVLILPSSLLPQQQKNKLTQCLLLRAQTAYLIQMSILIL